MKNIVLYTFMLGIILINTCCEESDIFATKLRQQHQDESKDEVERYNKISYSREICQQAIEDSLRRLEQEFIEARKVKMVDLEVEENNTITLSLINISDETTYVNSLVFKMNEVAYIQGDSLTNNDTISWERDLSFSGSDFSDLFRQDNHEERNSRIRALEQKIETSASSPNRNNDKSNGEANSDMDEMITNRGIITPVIISDFLRSIEFEKKGGLFYRKFNKVKKYTYSNGRSFTVRPKRVERVLPIKKLIKSDEVLKITFPLKDKSVNIEGLYFISLETLVNYDYLERVALADFTFTAG